jgi:vitamin B12 transporter
MDRFIETNVYYNYAKTENKTYNNDAERTDDYDGETDETGFQASLNFDNDIVTFGTSYYNESFKPDTASEKSSDTKSLWAQNQFFWGEQLDFVVGLRWDDHEEFGDKTTYRIAPSYTFVSTGTTVKGTYGTGFRSPSLYELYAEPVPDWFFSGGNKDLKPEKSKGWDLGVEQNLMDNTIVLGVTYFDMRFEDRIAMTDDWSTFENKDGTTKTNGIESFVKWSPMGNLDLTLNYTYTHAVDPDDQRLVRIPLNKVCFDTRYRPLDKLLLNLDVCWTDERDAISSASDKNGNTVNELDAYTVVNIAATYDICDYFQVYGRIDNLFDEYYEEAWSYATPGLSAYAGIKVSY